MSTGLFVKLCPAGYMISRMVGVILLKLLKKLRSEINVTLNPFRTIQIDSILLEPLVPISVTIIVDI